MGEWFLVCLAVLRTSAARAASGSAYAEFGSTKVIVSVFGPRESQKAMKYSDIGRLSCNELDNKELSSMLHKALEGPIILETFPKTTVDVFALVLESGGNSLRYTSALSVGLAVIFLIITAGIAIVKMLGGSIPMPRVVPNVTDLASFSKLFTVVLVIVASYICHYNGCNMTFGPAFRRPNKLLQSQFIWSTLRMAMRGLPHSHLGERGSQHCTTPLISLLCLPL